MNTLNTSIKYKQCRLDLETHKKLRRLAFDNDLTLTKMIAKLIDENKSKPKTDDI